MKAYRITDVDLPKIINWIKRGKFNFSLKCWQRGLQIPPEALLSRQDVHLFALEDDNDNIKLVIYAEVRDKTVNKLDVNTAVNCYFLMANDATKEHYKTLLKWILHYAYFKVECFKAEFWNLTEHAVWIQELCSNNFCNVSDEIDTPIGKAVKVQIDIKGAVEKWLS